MAKYETTLTGNFSEFLQVLDEGVQRGSLSASYEDGSDHTVGGVRCAFRVYERYSMLGGNRLSLAVMLMGNADELFLSMIAAGGSQAMFFKINTWGERSFLQTAVDIVEAYKLRGGKN